MSSRTLPMRRPGREGEKAYHFHTWELVGETEAEEVFQCARCKDQIRVRRVAPIVAAMEVWP